MTDIVRNKILAVANYIVDNKATIAITAKHFDMSEISIKKYINGKQNLPSIDPYLYKKVKLVQDELIKIGNMVGGMNGIRTKSVTEFEIEEIAREMIINGYTLKDASEIYNIPKSTIYDNLMLINDKDLLDGLKKLFSENKGEKK